MPRRTHPRGTWYSSRNGRKRNHSSEYRFTLRFCSKVQCHILLTAIAQPGMIWVNDSCRLCCSLVEEGISYTFVNGLVANQANRNGNAVAKVANKSPSESEECADLPMAANNIRADVSTAATHGLSNGFDFNDAGVCCSEASSSASAHNRLVVDVVAFDEICIFARK